MTAILTAPRFELESLDTNRSALVLIPSHEIGKWSIQNRQATPGFSALSSDQVLSNVPAALEEAWLDWLAFTLQQLRNRTAEYRAIVGESSDPDRLGEANRALGFLVGWMTNIAVQWGRIAPVAAEPAVAS